MPGKPSQCFMFKSCGRNVENATFDCALSKENTLQVHPFVESNDDCQILCQDVSIYFQNRFWPDIAHVMI